MTLQMLDWRKFTSGEGQPCKVCKKSLKRGFCLKAKKQIRLASKEFIISCSTEIADNRSLI